MAGAMNMLVTLLLWMVSKTTGGRRISMARITLAAPLATFGRQ